MTRYITLPTVQSGHAIQRLTRRVLTAMVTLYRFHTASYTSPYWPPPSLCFMTMSVRSISHSSVSVGEVVTTKEYKENSRTQEIKQTWAKCKQSRFVLLWRRIQQLSYQSIRMHGMVVNKFRQGAEPRLRSHIKCVVISCNTRQRSAQHFIPAFNMLAKRLALLDSVVIDASFES